MRLRRSLSITKTISLFCPVLLSLFIFVVPEVTQARRAQFCAALFSDNYDESQLFRLFNSELAFRRVEDGPYSYFVPVGDIGFRSSVDEHEMDTVRLASQLFRKTNTDFLFLPSFRNSSVPAFDGVQINAEGKPVANIQIKGTGHPENRLPEAIAQIDKFSQSQHLWISHFPNLKGRGSSDTLQSDAALLIRFFDVSPQSHRENVVVFIVPNIMELKNKPKVLQQMQAALGKSRCVHRLVFYDGKKLGFEMMNTKLLKQLRGLRRLSFEDDLDF